MNFFARRRTKKLVHHLLHEARHARHMREDVADPAALEQLMQAEAALKSAWDERDVAKIDKAAELISERVDAVRPPRREARIRENVEILAVALAVAMGFRTYFIQPFKIPTGSMQPTLYGITVQPQIGKKWHDHFPLNLGRLALFGDRYVEIRAKAGGVVDPHVEVSDEMLVLRIGGHRHFMHRDLPLYVTPGITPVAAGQLLASGRLRLGDHIFVNKLKYHFARPARGDIFVFSTQDIEYPRIRKDAFYIKRLAGLPGERISLDPPYLVADGVRVQEPYPFHRLTTAREKGYNGYQLPRTDSGSPTVLGTPSSVLELGPMDYLPLGDNTGFSLDGRYFGPVKRDSIVGPAFAVYWPLSTRWGRVQ